MQLKNKYVFGCLVQFYELEMLDEHIRSCVEMLEGIENKENVHFHFCFSTQEYLEKIDWEYFAEKYNGYRFNFSVIRPFQDLFEQKTGIDGFYPAYLTYQYKYPHVDALYTVADYRRELSYEWCTKVDMVCWSETDSLWPKETLYLLESLHDQVRDTTPKYIVNFADRRLWDNSFAPLHPMFESIPFTEDDEWVLNNEASGKSYMSLERMNEINNQVESVQIDMYKQPRFDGSCVCFTSDLLKSGVTLPHGILLHSEDVAMGKIAKQIMGDEFVQYCFRNILHVHNRRHPRKRTGVLDENNPRGFCGATDKGVGWVDLENASKRNFDNLFKQVKFETI